MKAYEIKAREANAQAQKQAMENNREQLEKVKQDYVQLAQAKLDNFDKKMDTLKDKVNNLDSTERTEVDKQIAKIDVPTLFKLDFKYIFYYFINNFRLSKSLRRTFFISRYQTRSA